MALNKQPTAQPAKKAAGGGWGSMFTSAVAGLESRLDTILADEPEASARQRVGEKERSRHRAGSGNRERGGSSSGGRERAGSPAGRERAGSGSREASRTRGAGGGGERLAERLARATAKKELGSGAPSRVGTPVARSYGDVDSARASGEVIRAMAETRTEDNVGQPKAEEPGVDGTKHEGNEDETKTETDAPPSTLLNSGLPINPAQQRSTESSARPSLDVPSRDSPASSRPSSEYQNGTTAPSKSAPELETEMSQLRAANAEAEKQRQREAHAQMERIDALQAKLQYLATETVAAAKEANASVVAAGSAEARLARKDEQIALLMQEGEKLSQIEFRYAQTIKKLRAKGVEDERGVVELRKRVERAEKAEGELKGKLRRAEAGERLASEKIRLIGGIEREVEELRESREKAAGSIRTLAAQLERAERRALQAEKEAGSKAAEIDKGKIAELQNELEDAQIERKLAEDKAKGEVRKVREEIDRAKERSGMREAELKNEIAVLDSRLEAMRARVEEASSGGGAVGDGSVKLMRQVETLQSQYGLAKENWETIEGSLNARLAALERERDEATKREAEIRKKARDSAARTRTAEDESERTNERVSTLTEELHVQQQQSKYFQQSFERTDSALADARADLDRQKRIWETELSSRIAEEKTRWEQRRGPVGTTTLRTDSPALASRKSSAPLDPRRSTTARLTSPRVTSPADRPVSRRSSGFPAAFIMPPALHTPDRETSPSLSRQESTLSFDMPPTPSIEVDRETGSDDDDGDFSSPQRTIHDLVSTSTAAGPSVQLVERMSAAVRRLESEKATYREELARLGKQRDEARDEIVSLMREVEGKREEGAKMGGLEKEVREVKGRYEVCLGLLGEREEEIEGLREDVEEMKKMYRSLVEEKVGK